MKTILAILMMTLGILGPGNVEAPTDAATQTPVAESVWPLPQPILDPVEPWSPRLPMTYWNDGPYLVPALPSDIEQPNDQTRPPMPAAVHQVSTQPVPRIRRRWT